MLVNKAEDEGNYGYNQCNDGNGGKDGEDSTAAAFPWALGEWCD